MILTNKRITKAPSLFAKPKDRFSCIEAHIYLTYLTWETGPAKVENYENEKVPGMRIAFEKIS